jgi:hypothetical protein
MDYDDEVVIERPRRTWLFLAAVGITLTLGAGMAVGLIALSKIAPVSSDTYFSRLTTLIFPGRRRAEQGANDNYFSRSGQQSGLLGRTASGYALLAG